MLLLLLKLGGWGRRQWRLFLSIPGVGSRRLERWRRHRPRGRRRGLVVQWLRPESVVLILRRVIRLLVVWIGLERAVVVVVVSVSVASSVVGSNPCASKA